MTLMAWQVSPSETLEVRLLFPQRVQMIALSAEKFFWVLVLLLWFLISTHDTEDLSVCDCEVFSY